MAGGVRMTDGRPRCRSPSRAQEGLVLNGRSTNKAHGDRLFGSQQCGTNPIRSAAGVFLLSSFTVFTLACTSLASTPRLLERTAAALHQSTEAPAGFSHEPIVQNSGRVLAVRAEKRRAALAAAHVSLGKVRPFKGDVRSPSSLATALAHRSYKRELILITDTRPRAALQLYDNLARFGLVHSLLLTTSSESCTALDDLLAARAALRAQTPALATQPGSTPGGGMNPATIINTTALMASIGAAAAAATSGLGSPRLMAPDDVVGCAWYSQPFSPSFSPHRQFMMKRVMLLTRAVRLGYNVLSLDTDVMVFRNPYEWLKSPPYRAIHMIAGRSIRPGSIMNTGVMYFQNISREGPVAWLLSEVIDRNLRWMEHQPTGTLTTSSSADTAAAAAGSRFLMPNEASTRGCWDQLLFGDVVLSSMTGKLALFYCARPMEQESSQLAANSAYGGVGMMARQRGSDQQSGTALWVARHRTVLGLTERQGPMDLIMREDVSVADDPELMTLVAGPTFTHHMLNLTVPTSQTPLLPDEPGYNLPPRQQGGIAEGFQQVLLADAQHYQQQQQPASGNGDVNGNVNLNAGSSRRATRLLSHDDIDAGLDGVAVHEARLGAGRRQLQQLQQQLGSLAVAAEGVEQWTGTAPSTSERELLPPLRRDTERLAYAADWLVGGWQQRGILGFWDPKLTNRKPRQVFGHLVRAPGPTNLGKEAVRMLYGQYDWELAALSERGPFPFLGSDNATDLPRVVALHPDADITTDSPVQWNNMARGLVQVALLTGRRVVWPDIPCASKWVQPNPGSRRALPFNPNQRFMAHGRFTQGLMCTLAAVLHPKCLYEQLVVTRNESDPKGLEQVRRKGPRGLLAVELAVLTKLLPESMAAPGPHNTVHLQSNDDYEDGEERPVMFDEPPRAKGIAYVKAAAVAQPLRTGPLAQQPVLYLAQRTFLTQLDKLGDQELMTRYRAFRNECPALR